MERGASSGPSFTSIIATSINRQKIQKIDELNASIEIEIGRESHNTGLSFLIPYRALTTAFLPARRAFEFFHVTDSIAVLVNHAVAATNSNSIQGVALAVASTFFDATPSANTALIQNIAFTVASTVEFIDKIGTRDLG